MNPLLRDLLAHYRYYWATHQAEYATDVLFTTRGALHDVYPRLLRHATLCLRAEDVLTFLGSKLHGKFAGEIMNDWKRRWPGARVKHWMKANWIKMYDKHGCVLRDELPPAAEGQDGKQRNRAGGRDSTRWKKFRHSDAVGIRLWTNSNLTARASLALPTAGSRPAIGRPLFPRDGLRPI